VAATGEPVCRMEKIIVRKKKQHHAHQLRQPHDRQAASTWRSYLITWQSYLTTSGAVAQPGSDGGCTTSNIPPSEFAYLQVFLRTKNDGAVLKSEQHPRLLLQARLLASASPLRLWQAWEQPPSLCLTTQKIHCPSSGCTACSETDQRSLGH